MIKYFMRMMLLILASCNLLPVTESTPTRPSITIVSPTTQGNSTHPSSNLVLPNGVYDALAVMQGICFESAWDAANQIFVIRSAEEHSHFYDLVDNSTLCSRLVDRHPFDFSQGDVLAGVWTRGTGCTASYSIQDFQRDDTAMTIRIEAIFSTAGDCPYELVRGLWLGFEEAQAYQISIDVSQ